MNNTWRVEEEYKRMLKLKKPDMSFVKDFRENAALIDWVFWALITGFCFLFYQHGDIFHTAGSAVTYLNGHILDFYDWNAANFDYDAYMPTTYIIFAIWDIPLRVLGLLTHPTMAPSTFCKGWYKLGTTLFFVAATYVLYKIVREKGGSKRTAIFAAFLFVANPIAIYSQFCFGQYDIFTTFFMLLGFYYYLRDDTKRFVLAFAVAITCKYFALLLFVPLILLKEKEVKSILTQIFGGISLFILELLVYLPSDGFREGVFGFNATNYVFDTVLGIAVGREIKIVVVLWLVLCAVAYLNNCDKERRFQWSLFYIDVALFLSFGLTFFHPQWVLMAIPFLTLTMLYNKHRDILLLVMFLLAGAYFGWACVVWQSHAGNMLFNWSIMGKFFNGVPGNGLCVNHIYGALADESLYYSVFSALLLVITIFAYPKYWVEIEAINQANNRTSRSLARVCLLGGFVVFFIAPTWYCVYYDANVEHRLVSHDVGTTAIGPLNIGDVYAETFVANAKEITSLRIMLATYGNTNLKGKLICRISDYQTGRELYTQDISLAKISDNSTAKIKLDEPVAVKEGNIYVIALDASELNEEDTVTLFFRLDDVREDGWAVYNGVEQDADLDISVFGR